MSIAYPESFIKDILSEIKTIAVVGASSKKDRDSELAPTTAMVFISLRISFIKDSG